MAFGVGDVCTRANGRGEKGGDVGEKTGPRPSSLPPRGGGGVTWSYQAEGWPDYEKGPQDIVGGAAFMLLMCGGKLAKKKQKTKR